MAFKMRKTPYPISSPAKQTNEERLLEIKRQRALLNNKKEFEEEKKNETEVRALTKDELKPVTLTVEGTGLDLITGGGGNIYKNLIKMGGKYFLKNR
tara:strand:+ start:1764 stop:2054 length:291 start_codon:yes stop_codon:yes gene_type:complete